MSSTIRNDPPTGVSPAPGTDAQEGDARSANGSTAPEGASSSSGYTPSADTLAGFFRSWLKQVRNGDIGVLPVVAGLVLLVVIFQSEDSVFLSAGNLTNLLTQGAVYMLLGMAEVFVLLLGEIDLSAGYVAGIGATVTLELATNPHNLPWWIACAAGLAVSTAIGLVQGLLITRLGLPSFIVTLAGYLGFQGLLIDIINADTAANGGTISVTNSIINDFVNGNLSAVAGWVVMVAIVAAFGVFALARDRRRRASGLHTQPMSVTLLKLAVMAAAGVVVVLVCNANRGVLTSLTLRGVPWVVLIVLGVLAAWTFLLGRTRFGRYVYAIGGNAEAARRAGVNLRRTRTTAFALSGFTSGIAGIIYASRLGSISTDIDSTLVLYAVAGAVIGGTSLFGGRGKMLHALLGGLVIAAIYNGLGLLGLSAATTFMVAALVLLVAVAVDAGARRGRVAR